jgi:site-specific recombinase XerC
MSKRCKLLPPSRPSSSTSPPSACCSTGWWSAQVLATNPAHAVRGPKHVVKRGKTPVLTAEQTRELLDSIDVSTVVGLRDRALIAVMPFALARVGAVVSMRVEDYYPQGKRWWVRLHEKGGKRHEMPAHHTLEAYLDAYIDAAGIREEKKTPLFRSAAGRTGALTETAMNRIDAWRMIQRRKADLGMKGRIGCHTFRATGITAYLGAGGTLENAQAMAAHESPLPPNFMTALATRLRSMRSRRSRFRAASTVCRDRLSLIRFTFSNVRGESMAGFAGFSDLELLRLSCSGTGELK